LQFDHVFALILKPVTCGTTQESLRLFFVGDEAISETRSVERHNVLEGWREVFLEDLGVVQGMHLGRASPSYSGGVFSPVMETPTHHFHNWIAERMYQPHTIPVSQVNSDPGQ